MNTSNNIVSPPEIHLQQPNNTIQNQSKNRKLATRPNYDDTKNFKRSDEIYCPFGNQHPELKVFRSKSVTVLITISHISDDLNAGKQGGGMTGYPSQG